jgi:signal peptidase I
MQGGPQELLTTGAELVADVLARFGRVRFRALGTSMAPTIQSGDVLDVRRCSTDELRVGDIVLVRGPNGFLAHRLVARYGSGDGTTIVTRGDAHWQNDSPIATAGVLGRVAGVSTAAREGSAPVRGCPAIDRVRGLADNAWRQFVARLRHAARRMATGVGDRRSMIGLPLS